MQAFKNHRMQTVGNPAPQNAYGARQQAIFVPIEPFRLEQFSTTELRIYQMLRLMFVLIPLVAGVDKFFFSITDWDRYLPITMLTSMHVQSHVVIAAVGIIEIAVACIVAINPRVGALAVILMLSGIMLNLVSISRQLPLVLLDGCLCVSALCLFLLASRKAMIQRFRL